MLLLESFLIANAFLMVDHHQVMVVGCMKRLMSDGEQKTMGQLKQTSLANKNLTADD
jgi:hypothetical protein